VRGSPGLGAALVYWMGVRAAWSVRGGGGCEGGAPAAKGEVGQWRRWWWLWAEARCGGGCACGDGDELD